MPLGLPPTMTNAAPAAVQPPEDLTLLTPAQLAASDWATQTRFARQAQAMAQQAEQAAEQRVQDQRFTEALTQNARMQNAEKAVNAALRFQGVRGFERDLATSKAAGLSDEQATLQALMRNAGRMFAEAPGDIAPSIGALRPPREFPARPGMPAYVIPPRGSTARFAPADATVQPFEPTVKTLEGGRKFVQTGPRSGQLLPSDQLSLNTQLNLLKAQIETAQSSLLLPGTKEEKAARQTRLRELEKKLDTFGTSTAQPTGDASPVVTRPAPVGTAPPAGATPSPSAVLAPPPPAAAAPPPAARTGYVIIRNKSSGARFRLPVARLAELAGDDRYELVK